MQAENRIGLLCLLALLAGCGSSGRFARQTDGGGDGGQSDAGVAKDGGRNAGHDGGAVHLGAACKKTADCGRGLFCDQEVDNSFPADNLPPGVKQVSSSAFPGGSCTPTPAAAFDPNGVKSCDPTVPQAQQGCGEGGVCISLSVGANTEVACRPSCDPTDAKGCGRFGYSCDFGLAACVDGCQSDEECRLQLLDGNGDGMADGLAYDSASKAVCDTTSFRCVLHGGGDSQDTGAPCTRLEQCEPEGLCLEPLQTYGGFPFPDGYCSKLGCDLKGRECKGSHATCTPLRSWSRGLVTASACFEQCAVGAEPEADRLGSNGHGQGCRAGYRCHYNGVSGAEQGVCVGGVYNSVSKNNVGEACKTDADCYSPYGQGNCIALSVSGVQPSSSVCTIMDCSVPGIPTDVCGAGNDCIGLNGDVTFCVKTCQDASECAAGYACADDDGDPTTGKICYPACFVDADCRKGTERCSATTMTKVGSCVASRR